MTARQLLAVALLLLVFVAPAFAAPAVIRGMPTTAVKGNTIDVTFNVRAEGASYYAIDELVPAGWTVLSASGGGDFGSQAGHVKWVVTQGAADITYTYTIRAPVVLGIHRFGPGEFQFEGTDNPSVITGANAVDVVEPAGDFSLSLSTATLQVKRGSSLSFTVSVVKISDYAHNVSMEASGAPANVTVSFVPQASAPPYTSVATVSAGSSATPGNFTLTITGRGADGKTRAADLPLQVQPADAPTEIIPVLAVESGKAALSTQFLPAGSKVTWNINRTGLIEVTAAELVTAANTTGITITIERAAEPQPALANAYRYFSIVSSVADSNLSTFTLTAAVEKSWLTANNILANTVTLNRFVPGSGWEKVPTVQLTEDSAYTYHRSVLRNFSVFGINGEVQGCPPLPQPGEWGECRAKASDPTVGEKTRTVSACSKVTGYTINTTAESTLCCLQCPSPGDWSACSAQGQRARKEYACSDQTGFRCQETAATGTCVSPQAAQAAVDAAAKAVEQAKREGRVVSGAEVALANARAALAQADYERAKEEADRALAAIPLTPAGPGIPASFLLAVVIVAAIAVALIFFMRRRGLGFPAMPSTFGKIPQTKRGVCGVCGQPTMLGQVCSVCGRAVCLMHMRNIGGRVYCSQHAGGFAPRLPGMPPGRPPPAAAWRPRPPGTNSSPASQARYDSSPASQARYDTQKKPEEKK